MVRLRRGRRSGQRRGAANGPEGVARVELHEDAVRMLVGILHDLVDQAGHATGRVNTVLTGPNGTAKLVGAMVAEEPRRELAPHASNGNRAHFTGLTLVERNEPGRVQNELGRIRDGPAHHNRQIRLRDGAQMGVMHHPVQELRRHASGIRRDPGFETANGGQKGGPLRELIRHGGGHGR
eukprot:6458397-Amphidinium_carterae.1